MAVHAGRAAGLHPQKFALVLFCAPALGHCAFSGDADALRSSPAITEAVAKVIEAANRELASYETIKKYEILDTDFSIETGELTAKLSVKRKVVNSKYGHIFDSFYSEKI